MNRNASNITNNKIKANDLFKRKIKILKSNQQVWTFADYFHIY